MQNNKLCILNNKSHTYLNSFTGSYSAIDLTLCDPVSYMDYGWKVRDDLCGSDHFPILLEILPPLHDEKLPNWQTGKSLKPSANLQATIQLCLYAHIGTAFLVERKHQEELEHIVESFHVDIEVKHEPK